MIYPGMGKWQIEALYKLICQGILREELESFDDQMQISKCSVMNKHSVCYIPYVYWIHVSASIYSHKISNSIQAYLSDL